MWHYIVVVVTTIHSKCSKLMYNEVTNSPLYRIITEFKISLPYKFKSLITLHWFGLNWFVLTWSLMSPDGLLCRLNLASYVPWWPPMPLEALCPWWSPMSLVVSYVPWWSHMSPGGLICPSKVASCVTRRWSLMSPCWPLMSPCCPLTSVMLMKVTGSFSCRVLIRAPTLFIILASKRISPDTSSSLDLVTELRFAVNASNSACVSIFFYKPIKVRVTSSPLHRYGGTIMSKVQRLRL